MDGALPLWVTVLSILLSSGVASAATTALFERRLKRTEANKNEADGAGKITEAAIALLQPYKDQLADLQNQIDEQAAKLVHLTLVLERYARRIEYLMIGISRLIQQLADAGIAPCWQPDRWRPEPEVKE